MRKLRLPNPRPGLLKLAKRLTRDRVTAGMEWAGAAGITAGAAQIYAPAGWIVGGLLVIAMAVVTDLGGAQ